MSTSKFIMACKLSKVQEKLMGMTIQEDGLESLLPLIFKACREENMMFWFNFMEDAVVLNLRDINHENYELNIRYAYKQVPEKRECLKYYKREVLINAFLITKGSVSLENNVTSSAQNRETHIISNDKPVPKHIRDAIKRIEDKGIPVTPEAIHNHLPLGKMSTSARMECNKYLKQMGAS